jgi:glycine/D-amino acid oxidase-like deaminating enzyme
LLLNHKIQSKLEEDLKTIILPSTSFEIDQQWAGIMAFGDDKYPILKRINNQLIVAVKLGGMGIALGSLIGEEAALLTLENINK